MSSERLARAALRAPLYPALLALACLVGGLWGIDTVGRLEDPAFPIKNAYVITPYPGASAVEVEREVTDAIEAALQELPYLDELTSESLPGRSEVQVKLLERYAEADLPQIWDELRRRVGEAALRLPPGAGPSLVEDDFGDIYGILYAIHMPDYAPADVHALARDLSARIKLVPGVAKVNVAGVPTEAVHVELAQDTLVRLGLPIDAVFDAIGGENGVFDAGSVNVQTRRLRLAPQLTYDNLESIRALPLGLPGGTQILRLGDLAEVSRGPVEEPAQIIRHDGERVFTLGVSVSAGMNVVDVGRAVEARLTKLIAEAPVGTRMAPIHAQHEVVDAAIQAFLRNLLISVATVVGALCLFMGWRAGTVVGSVLLLTVLGTIGLMSALGIELQRISLGALMIAMGMLVDNAIVVAEGMVVGVRRGQRPEDAAAGAVGRTAYALLGATVIGILAFAPIGLSADESGQFLRSLFQVVALSLLLSWVLAVTLVPVLGLRLLRAEQVDAAPERAADGADDADDSAVYRGAGYASYRALLKLGMRRRWLAAAGIAAVTAACMASFAFVQQSFFPFTSSPLFYVNFVLPEGTDIHATARQAKRLERMVAEDADVVAVSSFIGRGSTRYTATLRPALPNPALAQIIARVDDIERMNAVMDRLRARLPDAWPDAEIQVSRPEFTPGSASKIEARFQGPDAAVLRALASRALAVFDEHGLIDRKLDWRQRSLQLVPRIDDTGLRVAGMARADVYAGIRYATSGVPIGLYREADLQLPIIARAPTREREQLEQFGDRMIWSAAQRAYVPVTHVVERFELTAVDTRILRRDRMRTLTAQANVGSGENLQRSFETLQPVVEALPLPPGYTLTWGGEYESSARAREMLGSTMPLTYGLMFLITVLMFGRLRQPVVIWLTVPMVGCGVALSLVGTGMPFTFPASLGLLSLSGMLIKNCIVLVDEIDKRLAVGTDIGATIVAASVSRLRPVLLASGTTIAGMSPLLADQFFAEMAVAIMGGLAFSTLLTLIAVPVFYRIAIGDRGPDERSGAAPQEGVQERVQERVQESAHRSAEADARPAAPA